MDDFQAGNDDTQAELSTELLMDKLQPSSTTTNTQCQDSHGVDLTQSPSLRGIGSQFAHISDRTLLKKSGELTTELENLKSQNPTNTSCPARSPFDLRIDSLRLSAPRDSVIVAQDKHDNDSGYRSQTDSNPGEPRQGGSILSMDNSIAHLNQNVHKQDDANHTRFHVEPEAQQAVARPSCNDSTRDLPHDYVVQNVHNNTTKNSSIGNIGKASLWHSSQSTIFRGILNLIKKEIVENSFLPKVECVHPSVLQTHSIGTVCHGSSSGTQRASAESCPASSTNAAGVRRKRTGADNRKQQDVDDDDASGEDASDGTKRQAVERPRQQQHNLACHFYKKDPWKFSQKQYKTCLNVFPNTTELKAHYRRVHVLKNTCTRCLTTFKSEQLLSEHTQQPQSCPLEENPTFRGDNILEGSRNTAITARKPKHMTEVEMWYYMWDNLFPELERPTTPYRYSASQCLRRIVEIFDETAAEKFEAVLQQARTDYPTIEVVALSDLLKRGIACTRRDAVIKAIAELEIELEPSSLSSVDDSGDLGKTSGSPIDSMLMSSAVIGGPPQSHTPQNTSNVVDTFRSGGKLGLQHETNHDARDTGVSSATLVNNDPAHEDDNNNLGLEINRWLNDFDAQSLFESTDCDFSSLLERSSDTNKFGE